MRRRTLRLRRVPPQSPACPDGLQTVKLHTKIVLGLVLGAVSGVAANQLAPGAAWVRWVGDNVAGPVGQVFLRMLLMTVIPLVFTSITLGVAGGSGIPKSGPVRVPAPARLPVSPAPSARPPL